MNVVAYIQSVAALLDPLPFFLHGEKSFQNLKDDVDLTNGCVYLDEPITSTDKILASGAYEETYNLSILFAKKSALDATPQQEQVIIQEMRLLRRKFVQKIRNDRFPNVKDISEFSTLDVVKLFDLNLTGVYLKFKLIPYDSSQNVCGE